MKQTLIFIGFLGTVLLASAQLTYISVETVLEHDGSIEGVPAGYTTYRIYANLTNEYDFVSAVYGDSEDPMFLNNDDIFQVAGSGDFAYSVPNNPAFVEAFPAFPYDSWFTIGAENASEGGALSSAFGSNSEFTQNFQAGQGFLVDDPIGGSWFNTFPCAGQDLATCAEGVVGFAGADLKVLIGQITASGDVAGMFNVQVFVDGNQEESQNATGITFSNNPADIFGCTDPTATNYDPVAGATVDDLSCIFPCELELVTVMVTPPTCAGENDGFIQVEAVGAQGADYYYLDSFSDTPWNFGSFGGLFAGTSTIYAVDAAGCVDSIDVNVPAIAPIEVVATLSTPVSCHDSSDAVITITETSGGNGNFQYWLSSDPTNLTSQTEWSGLGGYNAVWYQIYAVDANGCTGYSDPIIVANPVAIEVNAVAQPKDCSGEHNGSVSWAPVNGTGDYTYFFDGTPTTNNAVDNLAAGIYTVTVTDSNGCSESQSVEVATTTPCIGGCTDVAACNYAPNATEEDGSCFFPDECGVCNGPGAIYECGCFDIPSGYCDCNGTEIDLLGECGGNCTEDVDADGICDDVDICVGTINENGDCNPTLGCTGLSFELDTAFLSLDADHPLADLSNHSVYNVYAEFTSPSDVLSALYTDVSVLGTPPMGIDAPCGCHSVGESPIIDNTINPLLYPIFPELEFATFWTIGMTSIDGEGSVPYSSGFGDVDDVCSGFNIDDGIIYVIGSQGAWPSNAVAGEDRRVLIARVATCGEFSIQACVQAFIGGDQSNVQRWCPEEPLFVPFGGCTNYDACGVCDGPGAIYECGCEDIPSGACDCDGNVLDVLGVCGGTCTVDDDNNGTCDDQEVYGCSYPLADNFNASTTRDDGSCIFPCEGAVNINVFDWDEDYAVTVTDFLMMLSVYGDVDVDFDGVWDSGDLCVDTEACNYDVEPSEECAYIDVLGNCGGGCEADADNDGICDDVDTCVGELDECGICNGPGPTEVVIESITILYDSVYLPQLDEWYVYEFGADTTFTYTCAPFQVGCGDPVSYQGYDYATVLIGDQCWFAENLRSRYYENGDSIPRELSDIEWLNTTSGAASIYGEGSSTCQNSPGGDACNSSWSLNEYGRLYNWYAVDDSRGLCPSGWHVPTDGEWTVLTDHLGGELIAGDQMKTDYGWGDGGNGTNLSGFSGLPGGFRDSFFGSSGNFGGFWSSTPSSSAAYRFLNNSTSVYSNSYSLTLGLSVRCVRDAK